MMLEVFPRRGGRRRLLNQFKEYVPIMPIIGYFFLAISNVLVVVLNLFMIVIFARAVLSWVSPDPYNPIVRFIHNVTEPVLHPIRRKIPINFGGIDFSPIIVLLAIIFLKTFLVRSFEFLGRSLI